PTQRVGTSSSCELGELVALFIYSLKENMKTVSIFARIKCAIVLLVLMSLSVIPMLPITSTLGLFIVIFRPLWFKKLVDKIYADKN
ncbi:MAG: hypothetical protein LUQ28_10000, partial [Methylococcaceae bacterium]|nr:hypothetical protein [Methylococcaceae bacterium]